jgi:hypothetical protein
MTDAIEETSRPAEIFNLSKNFFTSDGPAGRLMKAGRYVMDAQLAYTQALMRANAEVFAVWATKPDPQQIEDERPSVACKRNGVMEA